MNHVCSSSPSNHDACTRTLLRVAQCNLQVSMSLVNTKRRLPGSSCSIKLLRGWLHVNPYCFGNRPLYRSHLCAFRGTISLEPSLWDASPRRFLMYLPLSLSVITVWCCHHLSSIDCDESDQVLTRRTGLFGERNAGKSQQTSKQVHTSLSCVVFKGRSRSETKTPWVMRPQVFTACAWGGV